MVAIPIEIRGIYSNNQIYQSEYQSLWSTKVKIKLKLNTALGIARFLTIVMIFFLQFFNSCGEVYRQRNSGNFVENTYVPAGVNSIDVYKFPIN